MQNFNPDPKPGRLILPLVLIGMIATTYTFINRVATKNDLELVESEEATEQISTEPVEETTTSTQPQLQFLKMLSSILKKLQVKKFKQLN